MKLKHKDLLCIHDLSTEEVLLILDVAKKLKKMQKLGVPHEFCKGKTLAMMFSKTSTRTRVSFETGFHQLGGHAIYLNDRDSQIGRGEPIRDTARVLSRMVDGIMIRTFSHDSVIELAEYASIPVINGLTDLLHPCQALTDLLTIEEQLGSLKGRKLVYVGDGNNMAHSPDVRLRQSRHGYGLRQPERVPAGSDGFETGAGRCGADGVYHFRGRRYCQSSQRR